MDERQGVSPWRLHWRFSQQDVDDAKAIAKWPDEVKARIVSESLREGATVNDVAGRYGLKANHLSSWRTLARQGKLVLPEPEDAVEFAAVVVGTPALEPPTVRAVSRTEIVVGSVTIRFEEGASASRIASIARALAAAT